MSASEPHIHSAFDRDLDAVQAMVLKMGGMVEAAIIESARALEHRDSALADAVRERDRSIDALELQINAEAARIIAIRAPRATDMRMVLSIIKIASALERVGDYAKNNARRSHVLMTMPAVEGAAPAIRRMSLAVEQMVRDALDSHIRRDADLAEDVRLRDLEIDQMYNALFREFLTYMMEDPRNITACMHLHFIAKNIERMGDHATAIAEQVIYLVRGELPEEPRPKASSVAPPDGEGA